jgi:glycerol-3-phosphate O-acyltransferase
MYEVVLKAYLTALFKQNTVLEMFLETHRSRSGKIQRSDEAFFDFLVNTHLQESNSNKKDLIFVPVTINYDRVIEGEIFPLDLLGESVKKDSAIQIFKSLAFAKKQQGKVIVRYCQPISFEKKAYAYSQKLCMDLGSIMKNKE